MLKVLGELMKERLLLKRAGAAEELTYRSIDPQRRTKANQVQGQTRWDVREGAKRRLGEESRSETAGKDPPVQKPILKVRKPQKNDGRKIEYTADCSLLSGAAIIPVRSVQDGAGQEKLQATTVQNLNEHSAPNNTSNA